MGTAVYAAVPIVVSGYGSSSGEIHPAEVEHPFAAFAIGLIPRDGDPDVAPLPGDPVGDPGGVQDRIRVGLPVARGDHVAVGGLEVAEDRDGICASLTAGKLRP
jgi:hypothetical protein